MQSVKLKVSVRNHRIADDLPHEIPEGDVEVEIRFELTPAPAHESVLTSPTGLGAAGLRHLDALFARVDARSPGRSQDNIDRQIAVERAGWND